MGSAGWPRAAAVPARTRTPPQPWGQPGGYGSPPPSGSGKRNLLPFIVAGAAIVLVAVVLLVILLANSGGGGGSPQATAEDFVAAAKAGDCEKALALITDNLKEEGDANCADGSNLLPPDDASIEFGDVKVTDESDDTATAIVDVTFSGQAVPLTMRLVKQDGDWLIDAIGS